MADYFQLLSAFAVVFLALYYYFTSYFDFWKVRDVPGPRPQPIWGNMKDSIFRRKFIGSVITEFYEEYKNEPMVGIFSARKPTLILRDLDLIKDVLIKDFSTFDDRGITVHEKTEPLSQNLFSLDAKRWRPMRTRLSPVFTSGKLKEMFHLIVECSGQLEKYLEQVAEKGEPVDCRDIASKFTTDVIGSCAFGINMNALSEEENEFRRVGKKVFTPELPQFIRQTIKDSFPHLYSLLGHVLPVTETTAFFTKVITETMEYRKKNNIFRPDFVNMLIILKDNPEKLEDVELTDTMIAAQAFVFFVAGFETSSTTIGHALYEMALNPELQDKLREEIRACSAKTNGDLKYETVKEMKYLDKVFKETLRMYPPVTVIRRKCNKNYTFNGTKVSILKGMSVLIPAYAIQRDSSIYPNPDIFDPERFSEEAEAARHPMSFLPFGDGPRNCIGARFAVFQTKVGLIKMLENFRVDVCEKTMIPYVQNPRSFVLSPKDGVYLKISKVKN